MRKQIEVMELSAELLAWLCGRRTAECCRQAPGAEPLLQAFSGLQNGQMDGLLLRPAQAGQELTAAGSAFAAAGMPSPADLGGRAGALPATSLSATATVPPAGSAAIPTAAVAVAGVEASALMTQTAAHDGAIICKNLVIEPRSRRVTERGREIMLTPKEFDILYFLASNRGEVFTKEQIYEAVWEGSYLLDDSNIMAFIRKLRKKIEPNPDAPEYIKTVWGIGYQFNDRV